MPSVPLVLVKPVFPKILLSLEEAGANDVFVLDKVLKTCRVCFLLCGKLLRDWLGLIMKHPTNSEPCPPGEATAFPSYQ